MLLRDAHMTLGCIAKELENFWKHQKTNEGSFFITVYLP